MDFSFRRCKVEARKLSCALRAADRFTKSHENNLTYLLIYLLTTWLQYGSGLLVAIKVIHRGDQNMI